MRYRPFGKTGISISALGFGAMRLPSTSAGGKTVFDTEESVRIMRRAFELGVNYFDTAPYYCDGESEIIVGKALKGIRDKSPSTTPRITCPRSSTRAPSKRFSASTTSSTAPTRPAPRQGPVESRDRPPLRAHQPRRHLRSLRHGIDGAMVEENTRVASDASPLSVEELARVAASMEENKRLEGLYCTGCNYCMPCPAEVNIPLNFQLMNYHRVYKITDYAREQYKMIGTVDWMKGKRADACVECGECEEKCPQKLKICEQLKETAATLG